MKKFFKTCVVYRLPSEFYLFAVMKTPYGGITVAPATKLPLQTSPENLGNAALALLDGLPDQESEVDLATARLPFLAYLKENGFRNVTVFEKKAALVSVQFDGNAYDVAAHQKDEDGGFLAMTPERVAPERSAEAIGKGISAAFGHK